MEIIFAMGISSFPVLFLIWKQYWIIPCVTCRKCKMWLHAALPKPKGKVLRNDARPVAQNNLLSETLKPDKNVFIRKLFLRWVFHPSQYFFSSENNTELPCVTCRKCKMWLHTPLPKRKVLRNDAKPIAQNNLLSETLKPDKNVFIRKLFLRWVHHPFQYFFSSENNTESYPVLAVAM